MKDGGKKKNCQQYFLIFPSKIIQVNERVIKKKLRKESRQGEKKKKQMFSRMRERKRNIRG